MSRTARSRLAAQAAAAGYRADLLALIAHATLPGHRPGERLEDAHIEQVTDAVEVLAQAGYSAANLRALLADYQRRHGGGWRERFWARALWIASVRYRHPHVYGPSPCAADPDRLAAQPHPGKRRLGPPEDSPTRPEKEIEMTNLATLPLLDACPGGAGVQGGRPTGRRYLPTKPAKGAAMPNPIAERYRAATREAGGDCPIEAGVLGRLADHECPHGRLPGDRTPKCGCWPQENASVIPLPTPAGRAARPTKRRAA